VNIENFNTLLQVAHSQPQAQRLLFVFAAVELPDDATAQQKVEFEAGEGGALTPLMCVDKGLDELSTFEALAQEAQLLDSRWAMVFAAALAGTSSTHPTSVDAEPHLQSMVEAIKRGELGRYLAFDRQGQSMQLGQA
jgi:hypothetical protein